MTVYTQQMTSGARDCILYDPNTSSQFYSALESIDVGYGMYFQVWNHWTFDLNIPKNSTINAAYVQFSSYSEVNCETNVLRVNVYCEDADNPSPPTTNTDLYNRVRTSAVADWFVQNTTAPTYDYQHETPNFAASLQEVIDRAGWARNNRIAVLAQHASGSSIGNEGGSGTGVDGMYMGAAYSGVSAPLGPYLYVDYTELADGLPNVRLPQQRRIRRFPIGY